MIKTLFFFLSLLAFQQTFSQVLYSERFNGLTLNTGTYSASGSTQTYLYTDVPSDMLAINSGSLIADTLSGNYPFKALGQKQKAWLSYKAASSTDTFAVSTSWFKPTATASAWLITKPIVISASTILKWEAMAPDANNADGYEIYTSANTTTNVASSDFTNLVYSISAEKNTWQTRAISLGAFQGQTIRVAFKNNSANKFQLWLDDIIVENIATAYDVAVVSQNNYKYSTINSNNTISVTVKNNGHASVSNLNINYKMENNSAVTESKILSPALNYLESRELTFSIPFTTSTAAYYPYKIWTGTINNQSDLLNTNDTISSGLTVSTSSPTKKIVLEQYTSARNGWAPEAQLNLKSIVSTNTNVIAASIHYNDNMATTEGNTIVSDFAPTIPSATIDRHYFASTDNAIIERANWSSYIAQRSAMKVPVTVSLTRTYNPTTKQIDALVSATFLGDVKGDYRLNLYVKENNVYGPIADSTDNQWNQYNNLFNIPSSSYYQYGNLIGNDYVMSAKAYKHQYVINQMIDGAYGVSGVIPTNTLTSGQTYTAAFTYTLPVATNNEFRYNEDNIYLIGVVSEYDANTKQRSILNADEIKLTANSETLVSVKELNHAVVQLTIFPNPTSDVCYLNYHLKQNEFVKLSVYNTLGELVYIETKNVNAGDVSHTLNLQELPSGNYSVQVSYQNNSITKKLTIIK